MNKKLKGIAIFLMILFSGFAIYAVDKKSLPSKADPSIPASFDKKNKNGNEGKSGKISSQEPNIFNYDFTQSEGDDLSPVSIGPGDSQNFFAPVSAAKVTINENGSWDHISLNEVKPNQVGAVSLNATVNMKRNFVFSWDLKIDPSPSSQMSDGIGFVFHPLYGPGEVIIDSQGGAPYTLPAVFGREDGSAPVTNPNSLNNGQNIRSLGLTGGNLGISDLMNAIGFKIDTYFNDYGGDPEVIGTPYGSPLHKHHYHKKDDYYPSSTSGINTDNSFGSFVTTNSNGYVKKTPLSAPLNGNTVVTKNEAEGTVSGKAMKIGDKSWHKMTISYEANTYELTVKIDNSNGGITWKKILTTGERSVISNRRNWGFSILGSTGNGYEGHSIKNITGYFTPGNPVITTRYIDENGTDLKSSVTTIYEDWKKRHPSETDFVDRNDNPTIVKDGYTYRRAQVNGTFFRDETRINRRLGTPDSGVTVTNDGNNLISTTKFNNIMFINYVYRRELPVGSKAITSDLSVSINGGGFTKSGSLHPGDKVKFKYSAKSNEVPGIWSNVTAVQSLGGLFKPNNNLPTGVIEKDGLLYVPLNFGSTNDLKPGELGTNTVEMTYQGIQKVNLTANDQGQITVSNDPVISGQPKTSKIVSKVAIYDQSNQLIDDNGIKVYGSYFQYSVNNNSPLASNDLMYETSNYIPSTEAITLNDLGWWNVDSTQKLLTIYPHDLDAPIDTVEATDENDPIFCYSQWPWDQHRLQIEKVLINPGVKAKGSIEYLFNRLSKLKKFDGLANLDTSDANNMMGMFKDCRSLVDLDIKSFDTSKVTNMSSMFFSCNNLESINVTRFDTSNVTNMSDMFFGCKKLTELDVNNFNTSRVEEIRKMFSGCSSIADLDISNFDTSKVVDMHEMFKNCAKLTKLDLHNFDMTNLYPRTNFGSSSSSSDMFAGTESLWQLTLGAKTDLSDRQSRDGTFRDVGLKDPTAGTAINDTALPSPPNPVYYAISNNWREVGTGTVHATEGDQKTASQIIAESKTRNDTRTYVWDQIGKQTLNVGNNVDFGTHRGSMRGHNYVSSEQSLKVTDNRNVRNGKTWRIEVKVSKPFALVDDSSKKISGDPLYYQDITSNVLTHLTSVL